MSPLHTPCASTTVRSQLIRVLCVDDSRDITESLRMLIDSEPGMGCVGSLASADALVAEASRLNADVVLVDASMRGKNSFEAIGELTVELPQVRAIVFSAYDEDQVIIKALKAGAWGFVCKVEDPGRIIQAVREVASGRKFFKTNAEQR